MQTYLLRHKYPILLGIGIFCFIFIFFSQIHPVYPYDLDDWKIMHRARDLYPSIYEWNPTRVLPEILMPRCGEFAIDLFYPLTHDITLAICFMTSLLLATMVTTYCLSFYRLMRRRFSLPNATCAFLTLIFLACHFLIFRSQSSENQHLFFSYDLTDHYYYTIPNLLGSILVILFMTYDFEFFKINNRPVLKGCLLLTIYLMVFSNLFQSIILSAYLGSHLIVNAFSDKGLRHHSIREFASRYRLHLATISLWLLAVAFEPFGGNAAEISKGADSIGEAFRESVHSMGNVFLRRPNTLAVSLILIAWCMTIWEYIKHKEIRGLYTTPISLILSALVSSVFLTLLGTMSFPYYLERIMSVYAVPFFVLLSGFWSAALFFRWHRNGTIVLPLLFMLVFCNCIRRGNTFQDVQTFLIPNDQQYTYQVSPKEILEQNREYIQTVIEADQNGQDTAIIHVPRFEQDGNWPISWTYGRSLSIFLYNNHFISHKIAVTVIADRKP